MSQLPIAPLSPEQQKKRMEQLYLLIGRQVQRYHAHRHMGSNSSVPVELAQDLAASILYTVDQTGGMDTHPDMEKALRAGQEILKTKLDKAGSLLELVNGTAPAWQTECRWDALRCLGRYLSRYDLLHLAHKGPEDLFYPMLISPPEELQGIDCCIFYLNILWMENQIMAGVPEAALEEFWNRLPADTLNPCEPLLRNGIGKALIGTGLTPLTMEPEDRAALAAALSRATPFELEQAAGTLCQWLGLKDEYAGMYVRAVIPQLTPWTCGHTQLSNPDYLFL